MKGSSNKNKVLLVEISEALHKILKANALHLDKSLKELVTEALVEYLKKGKKK